MLYVSSCSVKLPAFVKCFRCSEVTFVVHPSLCGHYFCEPCRNQMKMVCAVCGQDMICEGNQPTGHITCGADPDHSLPGHEDCGTIVIGFNFDRGIQGTAVQIPLLLSYAFHCRLRSILLLQVRSIPIRGYPTRAYSVAPTFLTTRKARNCAACW